MSLVRVLLCLVAISSLMDYQGGLFTDAFSTYLLSSSGCETDLDTSEVIMNHAVVAAEDSDDLNIHVYVVGSDDRNSILKTYPVDQFPVTLDLQVITKPNPNVFPSTSDYQFAIEVAGKAYFPKGACEGKKRAAGALTETIQVVVEEPGATVWAAWASAHEKVRLTPVLEFITSPKVVEVEVVPEVATDRDPVLEIGDAAALGEPKEATVDDENGATATEVWSKFVTSSAGCVSVILSDATLSMIQNHPVHHDPEHVLHVESGTSEKIPAELTLSLDASYGTVVLEASAGATFERQGQDAACSGQRVAVTAGEEWPKLIIHEDRDIRVWAIYAGVADNDDSAILYRTNHLKLEYESSSSSQTRELVEPVAVDTMFGLELEVLPPPREELLPEEMFELQEEISKNKEDLKNSRRSRKRRFRNEKRGDRQTEKEQFAVGAATPRSRKAEKDARHGHQQGMTEPMNLGDASRAAAISAAAKVRDQAQQHVVSSATAASLLQTARRAAAAGGYVEAEPGSPRNVDVDFSVGPSYFTGLAILILANAAAIQICLVTSQRNMKGRRDL